MTSVLSLLVPGLLGPDRARHPREGYPRPAAPALEWLLARARSHPAPGAADALLFHEFGLSAADTELPVAAVTRLADGGQPDDGWWLRADPVHLRPDLQGVFLVDARLLAIEAAEAAALTEAFNHNFAGDGLRLEPLHPNRWYLRLPADPGVRACPLLDAVGRDINPLLPQGPAKGRWHAFWTEAQMLFHGHPVNRAREQRGQPSINGLWFWGGGAVPAGGRPPAGGLHAEDPLARGLARLTGTPINPVPGNADAWLRAARGEADSLVVLETTRCDPADDDPVAWADHVANLEQDWFAPCRRMVRDRRLAALRLHFDAGRIYTVTSAARWRFWRAVRPLTHYAR